MATYSWQWWYPFPPERLWPIVSDTDWVNRRAGLLPVTYEYTPQSTGGSRTTATMRLGPLRIRWYEPPFTWSAGEFHRVARHYHGGPLRTFTTETRLRPQREGTTIVMTVDLVARNLLGRMLIPLLAAVGRAGAQRAFNAAAIVARGADLAAVGEGPERGDAYVAKRVAHLGYAQDMLEGAGFPADLVYRFVNHLATADDRDVARMRPFALADRWRADRLTTLRLFLSATRNGLLNMSWDVLCPGCRGPKGEVESLRYLSADVHCDSCNISFGPQFDRSVEVTFNAGPLGKGVNVPVFCLAGPHATPHVLAQAVVAPGGAVDLCAPLAPGRYLAQAVGIASAPFEWSSGPGAAAARARIDAGAVAGLPEQMQGAALQLNVASALDRAVAFALVASAWPDTITTAAQVTALQEFRDLFSSEVLATGLELSIQSMTVLFTDLVGSTELYATTGDAPAFRIVHDHFAEMRTVIGMNNGAIVKTIGDAVMAVFVDAADALEAALLLPAAVGKVKTPHGNLMLRVGFHTGPCIAMRANETLDYFGTTVNLAARIQHVAGGGEVVMSAVSAQLPTVAELLLRRSGLRREAVAFKGFTREVEIVRLDALTPEPAGVPS